MTKIKVSTLEGLLLAEFVARVRGWEKDTDTGDDAPQWFLPDSDSFMEYVEDYRPDINGGQAMELVEEFDVWLSSSILDSSTKELTHFASVAPHTNGAIQEGSNKKIAICRAIVASKFGEYVEVN